MSAPVDILLDPLPNLILHSAIFIAALIIMILWINGTVEHPWAPTIVMFGFAFFNLLLSIRNKMTSNPVDTNPVSTNPVNTNEGEEEGAEGGHEISGGRTITNKQPSVSYSHDPNDEPGAKHGGSPMGRTQPIGTTYQATPKNKSPEVTSIDELAQTQAIIKARMSPPAQHANDMGDMGPDANFFPDN